MHSRNVVPFSSHVGLLNTLAYCAAYSMSSAHSMIAADNALAGANLGQMGMAEGSNEIKFLMGIRYR